MDNLLLLINNFIRIFIESAPWLLLGYFIAGLIKSFISTSFLHRHFAGNNTSSVIKGALLGAPLPLCSCGVIPAALGLHRGGASKAATTSFLIATPETGVDSVSVTYALLGPLMAIIRPIAAITSAIAAGFAVLFYEKKNTEVANHSKSQSTTSCCHKEKTQPSLGCCSKENKTELPKKINLQNKLTDGLRFVFLDIIKDTVIWLLWGFFIAALILTFLPETFLQTWSSSSYAYLIMAIIGVPMYICATASTPIAASLLFAGVSPGAILVFLLVGPATNIATLAMVKTEMGNKILAIYLSTIVIVGFLFAGLTDLLAAKYPIAANILTHQHASNSTLAIISAIILAMLMLYALYKKIR